MKHTSFDINLYLQKNFYFNLLLTFNYHLIHKVFVVFVNNKFTVYLFATCFISFKTKYFIHTTIRRVLSSLTEAHSRCQATENASSYMGETFSFKGNEMYVKPIAIEFLICHNKFRCSTIFLYPPYIST